MSTFEIKDIRFNEKSLENRNGEKSDTRRDSPFGREGKALEFVPPTERSRGQSPLESPLGARSDTIVLGSGAKRPCYHPSLERLPDDFENTESIHTNNLDRDRETRYRITIIQTYLSYIEQINHFKVRYRLGLLYGELDNLLEELEKDVPDRNQIDKNLNLVDIFLRQL